MTRTDFQQLAERRAEDAKVLLQAKRFAASYYLVGYAVECGLKACVMKRVGSEEGGMLFEHRRFQTDYCFTHDLEKLFVAPNLWVDFQTDCGSDQILDHAWKAVKKWSEASRYGSPTPAESLDLFTSVVDPSHGVLQWIRRFW